MKEGDKKIKRGGGGRRGMNKGKGGEMGREGRKVEAEKALEGGKEGGRMGGGRGRGIEEGGAKGDWGCRCCGSQSEPYSSFALSLDGALGLLRALPTRMPPASFTPRRLGAAPSMTTGGGMRGAAGGMSCEWVL